MINLLIGVSGSGKTYEAVVYHILPALASGRKVITNLPVVAEKIAEIEPGYAQLLHLVRPKKPGDRVFSTIEYYGDEWRHPDTGAGPLYVIDECHKALPRGATVREVEEWYAEHRHEAADVLLITQSYGKISKAICDNVQLVYRVRKNIALGSDKSYTRKVQDGIRGEVMNTSIRTYKPRYFPLYISHTRGGGAETMASDVRPIWKHWSFIGVGFCALVLVLLVATKGVSIFNPFHHEPTVAKVEELDYKPRQYKAGQLVAEVAESATVAEPAPTEEEPKAKRKAALGGPYEALGVHVAGRVQSATRDAYLFAISQNGQRVFYASTEEVQAAGYRIEPMGDCAARLIYGDDSRYVVCDAPAQGVKNLPASG